jgi:hypothetical protein
MQQRLTAGAFDHQDTGWRIWYFPGINDKGTIPRMQYITIRASPPLEERRKYLPEPGQKRGWQEDCMQQPNLSHSYPEG